MLGKIVDIAADGTQQPELKEFQPRRAWIAGQVAGLHPRLREFVAHAVEQVLDAHWDLDDEIGPYRYVGSSAQWTASSLGSGTLKVWGMLFETDDGVREVRRLRIGPAHAPLSDADARWCAVAAKVVLGQSWTRPASRVRVLEVGASDGSVSVMVDVDPAQAEELYERSARGHLQAMHLSHDATPGVSCGGCGIAGLCGELVDVDGMLGQPGPGVQTRSVSPQDLSTYAQCPAKWYLARELHLPREQSVSGPLQRGIAVHEWLRRAHARTVACTIGDLPEAAGGQAWLSTDQYDLARPFLVQHVDVCPLADRSTHAVAIEESVFGYDRTADVVTVTKPDMILLRGDIVVLREVKTRDLAIDSGRSQASTQYPQVQFGLAILAAGLLARYGAVRGVFELEVLTASVALVWTWSTENTVEVRVAQSAVRELVEEWHTDQDWTTRPSPLCATCTVRRWCTDRDTYEMTGAGAPLAKASALAPMPGLDDDWDPASPF